MSSTTYIYELKVTLRDSKPPIWRRIQVEKDITLPRLHKTLQIVFDWYNVHLHEFIQGNIHYLPSTVERYDLGFESGYIEKKEKHFKLSDLLQEVKQKIVYEYDFGDCWEHDIVLERIVTAESNIFYPRVIAGKLSSPPEDSGSMYGYYDKLQILQNPEHKEHDSIVKWMPPFFDPKAFDLKDINRTLQTTDWNKDFDAHFEQFETDSNSVYSDYEYDNVNTTSNSNINCNSNSNKTASNLIEPNIQVKRGLEPEDQSTKSRVKDTNQKKFKRTK